MLPRNLQCHWIVSLLAVLIGVVILFAQQKKQIKMLNDEINRLNMAIRRLRQVVYSDKTRKDHLYSKPVPDEDVNKKKVEIHHFKDIEHAYSKPSTATSSPTSISVTECDQAMLATKKPYIEVDDKTFATKKSTIEWYDSHYKTTFSTKTTPSVESDADETFCELSFKQEKKNYWSKEEKQSLKDYIQRTPRLGRESVKEYFNKCAASFQNSKRNGRACKSMAKRMCLEPEYVGTSTRATCMHLRRISPLGSFYQLILTHHHQDDAVKALYRKNGWTLHAKVLSEEVVIRSLLQNTDEDLASFIRSTSVESSYSKMQQEDRQTVNQSADYNGNINIDDFVNVKHEVHKEPVYIKREPESEALEEENELEFCTGKRLNNQSHKDTAETMDTYDFVVVKNEFYDEPMQIKQELERETYSVKNEHESEPESNDDPVCVKSEPETENDCEVKQENIDSKNMNTYEFVDVTNKLFDELVHMKSQLQNEPYSIQNESEGENDLDDYVGTNCEPEIEIGVNIALEDCDNERITSAKDAESIVLEGDSNPATDFEADAGTFYKPTDLLQSTFDKKNCCQCTSYSYSPCL